MSKVLIAPSILSADFSKLGEDVANLQAWGADMVHCDVMDGEYVPNITFGMPIIKAVKKFATIPFDVHLMISKPERYIKGFVDAGADIITFHPEASQDVSACLDLIHSFGIKAGLVLNPNIDCKVLLPYMDKVDLIEVMGVYAGFGGQKFIPETIDKLRAVKALITAQNRHIWLEVDGGVCLDNAAEIKAAGADLLVAGSAVFGASDPSEVIALLKK